jgi:hypothetical protein
MRDLYGRVRVRLEWEKRALEWMSWNLNEESAESTRLEEIQLEMRGRRRLSDLGVRVQREMVNEGFRMKEFKSEGE